MGRAPSSAAFEPEPLGPRRRRVDPVLVGVVVVVIALAVAVIKPWAGPDSDVASTSARPSASTGRPSPAASSATASRSAATSGAPITWSIASAASRPHATWGVRAIVPGVQDGGPGLRRTLGRGDPRAVRSVRTRRSRRRERDALGRRPADGRCGCARPGPDVPARRAAARRPRARRHRGRLDLARHEPAGSVARGRCRALRSATDRRGGTRRPGRRAPTASRSSWPTRSARWISTSRIAPGVVPGPGEVDPLVPDPVVADPLVPSWRIRSSRISGRWGWAARSRSSAGWRSRGRRRSGRRPTRPPSGGSAYGIDDAGLDRLPAIYAPTANGLGYVFPTGATAAEADLLRILPAGPLAGMRQAAGLRTDGDRSAPYAIFRAPDGRPWPAGIYRISLRWTDEAGPHQAAVHLDLHPGPLTAPPTILGSLPGLAWAAGRDGAIGARGRGCAAARPGLPGRRTRRRS